MKVTYLLLLFVSLVSPCYSQENSGFESFLRQLQKNAINKRQGVVEKYLLEEKQTPVIGNKTKVYFTWYGKADTVKIEGDLQKSWMIPAVLFKVECGEKDFFYISYDVPSDALLEYDFIVDGKRSLDPTNPNVVQGFDFSDRNIFNMPDFVESSSLKFRQGIDKGTVVQWTFKTNHELFTNQPIWIYTPYNYLKNNKYPVLFVLDGAPSLYSRPFLSVINNLIYEKKIEPIVVVFISFEDRWQEYVEKSKEYSQWMVDEVVPFIEKSFSVASSPEKRAIMGASASGHGAIVAALRHPDVFGNVASQGGGAGGYPGLNPLANEALDVYLTKKDQYPLQNLYTEVGTFDLEFPSDKIVFADGVVQFNDRLNKNKVGYVFTKVNGGHSSRIWDQRIDKILISFFGEK